MHEIEIENMIIYLQEIEKIRLKSEAGGNSADLMFRGQNCDKSLKPRIARLSSRGKMLEIERLILEFHAV